MTTFPTAIVIGVDSPIGLTVVRELGIRGVSVHGVGKPNSIGRASRFCGGFSQRPRAPMAEWLPRLIAETDARAVLAISEGDLLALADLPAQIGNCRILTPRAGPLGVALDKAATLRHAATLGIDTPQCWQPMAGEDFAAIAAGLTFPVVAKWADPVNASSTLARTGLEVIKADYACDVPGLLSLLNRYAPAGCWPLIQSYCPGVGLGQMIHIVGSEATLRFQHRRLHEWPPEGGVSTWCATEPLALHSDQMERSIALLVSIGWQGTAMVEYRFDAASGRYWLMEINGRFWGSLPLAWHAGAHFAWEAYRRAILADTTPSAGMRVHRKARYMIPETRRLVRVLLACGKIADPAFTPSPLRDLVSYLASFFDPRARYYVWSFRDPWPFFSDLIQVARKMLPWGSD